jgi:hypothetical protein
MPSHPTEPLLVHRLPPAPHFVGRDDELTQLRNAWASGFRGVVALVGLGGAGKTAVAARFLDDLLAGCVGPRPDGLFVWSFYQEPDAGLFLEEAYRYFAGGRSTPAAARGAGLLHLLRDALAAGGPHLLVLDGLERVQRPGGEGYGQVEDPLLRGLLIRLAEGRERVTATALVTSRFPLTDIAAGPVPYLSGYQHFDVGGLPGRAALDLLRQRGVVGDDEALAALVERYGSHALTLDHLGGVLGQFLGGDPGRAPEVPELAAPGADRQALRLARLLRAYEEHLPPEELALLCRLCLLRRGADEDHIRHLFLCNPPVHLHTARQLAVQIERLPATTDYSAEDLEGLAAAVREAIEAAVCEAPVAGPEEAFRHEVLLAAVKLLELHSQALGVEMPELVRFYSDVLFEAADERHPLSTAERQGMLALWRRYEELSRHPLLNFKKPPAVLQQAFVNTGWVSAQQSMDADFTAADIHRAFRRVKAELQYLTFKHFLLGRVRELCHLYQRKWALAGPLAHLDVGGLRQALTALAGRHLILRESDGTFSVHPAIRDHFARLAADAERGDWHDLLRQQMISLAQRPGRHLPEDARTLDLVEEAIFHALQAGRRDEAEWLYQNVLGGLRHLGWKLGETNRGLRVLRQFDPCPDRWALAWHLRALGELDEAHAHNTLPSFRADVRLLQGRLPLVADEREPTRSAVAAFLMGQTTNLPPSVLGGAVPRLQVLLYLGRHQQAWRALEMEGLYADLGWGGEQARCRLLLADLALRSAGLTAARQYLDEGAAWVLHSGSAEHLALLHLVRARVARATGEGEAAQRAADDGLHIARQCGLGLALVELLCEQGEIALARSDPAAAEDFACAALERAVADNCRFAWGEAAALHLWGRALFARERTDQARAALVKALDLGRRIGDPRADDVGRLLARHGG